MRAPLRGQAAVHSVLDEIKERDLRDKTRKVAPLKATPDAYYLDNSQLSFEQTVAIIVGLAKTYRPKP